MKEVLRLYKTLHEVDFTKFYDNAIEYFKVKGINYLKRIRKAFGISQSKLAKMAEVDLR